MSSIPQKPKILAIIGPTASGKSKLAVTLAQRLNGEVVSADSRQVYKGLNIGSGKITKREMRGIPHHLLGVASPRRTFTVHQYQKFADRAIKTILSRGKLPILCGGTGLYIDAVLKNATFPEVPPNQALRKRLDELSADTLFQKLKRLDPRRAKTIDRHNKRRLIRALEIIAATKRPIEVVQIGSPYAVLKIGVRLSPHVLQENINKRLVARLRHGLVREVAALRKDGISWQRLDNFGLEYRYVSQHLQGILTRKELISELEKEIWQYTKRQMTWFKRDTTIRWITNADEAISLTRDFLKTEKK